MKAALCILLIPGFVSAANFLTPDALNLRALLPPPPAADSPATRIELDQIFALQKSRTPEQAARCVQIESEDIWLFGSEVVGPWFTAANLPKTAAFFALVRDDFIAVNRAAKEMYPRKRPPFADERIKPCVECKDTPSYPSGHGIQSSVWATLLGEIFPDKAGEFLLRAATTRNYKAISGVHYPSDLAAGQAIGEAFGRALIKNPAVARTITKLRAEALNASTKSAQNARLEQSQPAPAKLSHATNPTHGTVAPVSLAALDSRWASYGGYLQEFIERAQARWDEILRERKIAPPHGSRVAVTVRLNAKGEVVIVRADDSGSGRESVRACLDAIASGQPYRAWPAKMRAELGEATELTFTFHHQSAAVIP
jgi:acid phosphatase (class A)